MSLNFNSYFFHDLELRHATRGQKYQRTHCQIDPENFAPFLPNLGLNNLAHKDYPIKANYTYEFVVIFQKEKKKKESLKISQIFSL